MKTKRKIMKALSFAAAAVMIFSAAVIPAAAVTVPELAVTSNEYGPSSRIVPDEVREIDAGGELQLYAIVKFGNEMGETPAENGWFVEKVLTEGVSWKSADGSVATVDGKGLVTGAGAGRTKITATLDGSVYGDGSFSYPLESYEASFEITVRENGIPFSDVKKSAWYFENVKFVSDKGLMDGVSGGKFSPDGTFTRAMAATVIWRLLGRPEGADAEQFRDVPDGAWYADAVRWARSQGIVQGVGNDRFGPDERVTRAMFAVMIHRCGNYLGFIWAETDGFGDPTDIDAVPDYAKAPVTELFRAGVVKGKGGGIFDPISAITRAEGAALLERAYRAYDAATELRPWTDGPALSDVRGEIVRCGYSSGDDSIAALHSRDEVGSFVFEHSRNFTSRGAEAAARLLEISDEFFVSNTLAVGFITVSSGSIQFFFNKVTRSGDGYVVDVFRRGLGPGEAGTCDMATWCVIAPIPEKDVDGSDITLSVNGTAVSRPGPTGTALGFRFTVDAWVDKMPSLGGKIPNITVTLRRIEKTGEQVPDIGVFMTTARGSDVYLVRDNSLDRADSCVFRAVTDDPDDFRFYSSGITGSLTFVLGDETKRVPFSVWVSEKEYM